MLTRIARTSYRHRRAVLAIWLVALALAIVGGSALAGEYATNGRLPNTDSQRAYDRLAKDFPQRHGDEGQIVFADVRHDRPAIDAYLANVAKTRGVIGVEPLRISKGGLVAVAPITTASGSRTHPQATANHIKDLAKPLQRDGVDVQFSGNWFGNTSMPASEIVGILAHWLPRRSVRPSCAPRHRYWECAKCRLAIAPGGEGAHGTTNGQRTSSKLTAIQF